MSKFEPSNDPIGVAIKITPENKTKLSVMNNGDEVEVDETLYAGSYLVFLYNMRYLPQTLIVPGFKFEEFWAFIDEPSDDYFTEIIGR